MERNRSIAKSALYPLIVLSGCAALIYELVWARILHLLFGVSSFAVATVVAVFMLGLALGSWLFGRIAEKRRDILTTYAFLELAIGLFSILSFLALKEVHLLNTLYYSSYNQANLFLLSMARFLIAALILLPPTICIGGTIPLITKYLIRKERTLGSDFSRIYYLNTLGAMSGVFATGFLLIRFLGVTASFLIAVLFNILIFLGIRFLSTSTKDAKSRVEATKQGDAGMASMLLILFLTGFISLAYEVLLVRVYTVYSHATTYSFTIILAGFLAGITLGSWAVARRIDRMKRPLNQFIAALTLTGLAGPLILLCVPLLKSESLLFELGGGFLLSTLFATLLGLLFPLGLRIYAGSMRRIGSKTGSVYFANTLGAMSGSIVAGFLLIPFFGIRNSVGLLSLIAFLIAGVLLSKRQLLFAVIVLASTLILLFSPSHFYHTPEATDKLLYYGEGLSGTVTVVEYESEGERDRELAVDSNGVAGNGLTMTIDAKLLAHVPLLLDHAPKRAATVGYGTGGTSQSMLLHKVNVTAIEIEKRVIEASLLFPKLSPDTLDNPAFTLILDDARNYLQATDEKFDVIVTDVTNLKYKSNPNLYTTDYFTVMKGRLAPDGIAAAWVPLGGLSFNDLRILIASFHHVYPHTTIWFYSEGMTHFLILIGTEERLHVDLDRIAQAMAPVQEDLSLIGIKNETVFGSMLLLGEEDVTKLSEGVALHTDEHPLLEYSDMNVYLTEPMLQNLELLLTYQQEDLTTYYPEAYREAIGQRLALTRMRHEQIIKINSK